MATIRYWFGQYQRYGGRMLGFKSPILKFFIGVRPDVAADPRHMKNDRILVQTDSKINFKLNVNKFQKQIASFSFAPKDE